ncbi:MAG: hypothetical protein HY744_23445 [Deltaproteobacteria bacterium]|nr:hypothetical protein [Deltaproteobacteria bacterium]
MASGTGRGHVVQGVARPRWFAPLGASMGLVALVGAFVGYDGFGRPQPDASVGGAGLGVLLAAIAVVLAVATATRREIRIDGEGIDVRIGRGEPTRIRWSEPHDFFCLAVSGTVAATVEKARLQTADGRRIDVDNWRLPGSPAAGLPRLVEQYSTAASWPKIEARLDAGEEVGFGAVKVSRERILLGERSHPMDKGLALQLDQGRLRVGAGGKWEASDVCVRDVANYPCLLRAIGQVSQARPPG